MKSVKGFSLIELLIVVVIIGIIAAIAVPNLLASRRAANEATAVSALRTIHGAQNTYASSNGNGNYAGTVAGLDGVGLMQLGAANLIDNVLASGSKGGYTYATGTTQKTSAEAATFCTRTIPLVNAGAAATGLNCFGISTDGVIKMNTAADVNNCGCSIVGGGVVVDRATPIQ